MDSSSSSSCSSIASNCLGERKRSKPYFTKQELQEIHQAFDLFDPAGTGTIDIELLKVLIWALGYGPKKGEIDNIISEIDYEGTGKMTFGEFFSVITQKKSETDTKEEIMEAFYFFTDDETDKISFTSLKQVVKELRIDVHDEEVQQMIDVTDRDRDGEVNEEEFLRMMRILA